MRHKAVEGCAAVTTAIARPTPLFNIVLAWCETDLVDGLLAGVAEWQDAYRVNRLRGLCQMVIGENHVCGYAGKKASILWIGLRTCFAPHTTSTRLCGPKCSCMFFFASTALYLAGQCSNRKIA